MTGTDGALHITTSPAGLHLRGEIDAHSVTVLVRHLDPLPGAEDEVVIDLSEVGFVDSSGLRVLVEAHQRAEAEARRLVLSGSSRPVLRLLEISGLMEYLHVRTAAHDEANGSDSDQNRSSDG
ncbi:MAG TPA: STAS domain-containing protein [Ilumatobacteraceae bacterium]|nr:STAS domain-containing protein [Ilumatobacteraceae bacterium]